MNSPRIGTDSLLGVTASGPASVPLANVGQMTVRRTSVLKTAGLVLGLGTVAFVGLLAAAFATCGEC